MASAGSPSRCPLTIGNRRSARATATAATTKWVTASAPRRSIDRIRLRKSTRREASTSSMVWMWGISDHDRAMLRATTPRTPRRSWRPASIWPSSVWIGETGDRLTGFRGSVADSSPMVAAARTSSAEIRPPGPDPRRAARSTPTSRASRRVAGEALTRPPVGAVAGSRVAGVSVVAAFVASGVSAGRGAS